MSNSYEQGGTIRVKAVTVIKHRDQYLFEKSYDSVKDQPFFMPFGGGVEFGESSSDAVIREIKEELGIGIPEPTLLGVKENRFTFENRPGHEVVFVYRVILPDNFDRDSIVPEILHGKPLQTAWLSVSDVEETLSPIYPEGLQDLLLTEFAHTSITT